MTKSSARRSGTLGTRSRKSALQVPPVEPVPDLANPSPESKTDLVPLQVRLPRDAVRAIKMAALQRDMTVSEFMLECFHAHTAANESA